MNEKDEPPILGSSNRAAERYANQQFREARYAAETCGCQNCVGNYELWLNWFESKGKGDPDDTLLLLPPPTDFPHAAGPSGPNDDPPPDINSGNLADWYGRGL